MTDAVDSIEGFFTAIGSSNSKEIVKVCKEICNQDWKAGQMTGALYLLNVDGDYYSATLNFFSSGYEKDGFTVSMSLRNSSQIELELELKLWDSKNTKGLSGWVDIRQYH